jgi:hypothetical protein
MKKNLVKFLVFPALALAVFSCSEGGQSEQNETTLSKQEVKEQIAHTHVDKPGHDPASTVDPDGPVAVFNFATTVHDFGTINEGDVVQHTFEFTNEGETPLIIQDVKAPCGCTTPNWTKTPVAPGEKGVIDVKFDSRNKPGVQNKKVTITANTHPNVSYLEIRTNVNPKTSDVEGPVRK